MNPDEKYKLVKNLCKKYCNQRTELDDLANEMWLEVWDVEPMSHVITKTRSRLIDRWRKEKRYKDNYISSELVGNPEPYSKFSSKICFAELNDELNKLIKDARLTNFEKDLLYQKHYLGLEFRTISTNLKIGLSKIHGLYHEALDKIKTAKREQDELAKQKGT